MEDWGFYYLLYLVSFIGVSNSVSNMNMLP